MTPLTPDRERHLQWALAVLATLGLVAALLIGRQAHQLVATDHAGTAAMKVARASVPEILSYTDSGLANQLASSRRLMTPSYAKRYASMVKIRVWPQARKYGVANQVRIVSSAVVDSTKTSAVILIFANQTTRTKAKPSGLTQGTRLEVSLRRHDSTWLVDDLRPL